MLSNQLSISFSGLQKVSSLQSTQHSHIIHFIIIITISTARPLLPEVSRIDWRFISWGKKVRRLVS